MATAALSFRTPAPFRAAPSIPCPKRRRSLRVSAENSEGSSSSSSSVAADRFAPSPPPGFRPPEPKRFSVRPDKFLDILGASLSLPFRLGTGAFALGYSASLVMENEVPPSQYFTQIAGFKLKETSRISELRSRPEKPIEIYDFEGCPFCRKVREVASVLDLDILYYPCPRNGPNFRPQVLKLGGKTQFPYMVDPNTGVSMYESDGIIKYLVDKYGDGSAPVMSSLGLLTVITAGFAMIARMGKGSVYTPSRLPPHPVEIWAYEASPFCKIVREVLVELEIPHLFHSTARGSPKRQELFEKVGHFQVPYLEDPNTGVKMFESAEIIDYLKATYALT